ncbi:MAG TPA: response regulator [Armatimonadetes bacterium]|nr:response regulator [Armatimonadota bacterium]
MAKKILVADDEVHIVRILTDVLTDAGYEVIPAFDGKEALEKALEEKPDLVFLDLMMPEMSGYEVCRRLREEETTRDTLIFMLTARGQESDEEEGYRVGADLYLTKPFAPRKLVRIVQEKLGK